MKRNTGLKWVKLLLFLLTLNMFFPLGECRYIYMAEITLVADDSGSLLKYQDVYISSALCSFTLNAERYFHPYERSE